jgi:hypothetical protein
MSIREQINLSEKNREAPLTDVLEEGIAFQVLQGLARIENRLASIEHRLEGGRPRGAAAEKPNLRNQLISLLQKGWLSEDEAMQKTGWQTIGVRSFITKLRTLGLVVETEDRNGVPHYRIAK